MWFLRARRGGRGGAPELKKRTAHLAATSRVKNWTGKMGDFLLETVRRFGDAQLIGSVKVT